MKITPFLLLVTILGLSLHSASAKKKEDSTTTGTYGCAKFDVNENGVLDPEEVEALRKAFSEGETALKPLDINNDGKLDDSEIALIKLPKPSKEKKKKKNG
jgi:hypothetical protein